MSPQHSTQVAEGSSPQSATSPKHRHMRHTSECSSQARSASSAESVPDRHHALSSSSRIRTTRFQLSSSPPETRAVHSPSPPANMINLPTIYRASSPLQCALRVKRTRASEDHWSPDLPASPPAKRILLRDYLPTSPFIAVAWQPRWGAPLPPPPPMDGRLSPTEPPAGLISLQGTRYRSPTPERLNEGVKLEPEDESRYHPCVPPKLRLDPHATPKYGKNALRFWSEDSSPRDTIKGCIGHLYDDYANKRNATLKPPSNATCMSHRPGPRRRADDHQLAILNAVFDRTAYPSTEEREDLARRLGMTSRSVQIWFQNRRRSVKVEAQSARQREENDAIAARHRRRAAIGDVVYAPPPAEMESRRY